MESKILMLLSKKEILVIFLSWHFDKPVLETSAAFHDEETMLK